jgi:hypothetical protein
VMTTAWEKKKDEEGKPEIGQGGGMLSFEY